MSPMSRKTALTVDQISPDLRDAKRAIARRFLAGAEVPMRFTASRASAQPSENVVGVGIGTKVVKGKATTRQCVRIYVERKLAKGVIPRASLLPDRVEGIETDVIESGRFRALAVPIARRRLRPAKPSCSCGFRFTGDMARFVMAGSMGAVVQRNGVRHIISNNHVLANENQLPLGSPIFQPGLLDGGEPASDQIAKLTQFVAINFGAGGTNTVDAAIAEVLDPSFVSPRFLPLVGKLKSGEPIAPTVGMNVEKHGRTTGYTRGKVFDVAADVQVGYDGRVAVFQDQVVIVGGAKPFSDAGDSGSVIIDRATKRATALLFAGSSSHTLANSMSEALNALGATLAV